MTTLNFPLQLNHGLLLILFLFLFALPFMAAQQGTLASSPPQSIDPFTQAPQFNPSLAILMVIIVSAFFFIGFFTVYVRQCSERRFHRGNFNTATSQIFDGGWRSRRAQQGLDAAVIETFPTFLYSTVKGHKIGKVSLECAVCLNEFEDDHMLRLIPKCSHVFHPDCIDAWLTSHTTCPVCRANLVPIPGESSSDTAQLFETQSNAVEVPDEIRNDVSIQVSYDNDRNRAQPQEVILPNTDTQNRPPRSWSTGWRLGKLFPRSHSTGHTLVQAGENLERFTLRLPVEVRSQLMNTHLNRTKSCMAFTRATSSRKGYRTRSGGIWRSRNYFYYERFDREGRPDRDYWGLTVAPFISRSGSVPSSKHEVGGSDEVNATPPKSSLKSVTSPLDHLLENKNSNDVGERSSRLRDDFSDSQV